MKMSNVFRCYAGSFELGIDNGALLLAAKKKLDESHKASSEKIDSIKKQREQKVRMSAPRIGC